MATITFPFWRHKRGDRLLDVGCNTAEAERLLLRDIRKSGKSSAWKMTQKRYDYALSKLQKDGNPDQIELKLGDALDLPFPGATFRPCLLRGCVGMGERTRLGPTGNSSSNQAERNRCYRALRFRHTGVSLRRQGAMPSYRPCIYRQTADRTANSAGSFINSAAPRDFRPSDHRSTRSLIPNSSQILRLQSSTHDGRVGRENGAPFSRPILALVTRS